MPLLQPVNDLDVVLDSSLKKNDNQAENSSMDSNLISFRQFAEQANTAIAITDLKSNLIYVNPVFCKLLDRSSEELIGEVIRSLYAPNKLASNLKNFAQLMATGELKDRVVWYSRPDGSTFPARVSAKVLKDGKGKRKYLTATLIDESERYRLETQQQLHLAHMELISEMNEIMARGESLYEVFKYCCSTLQAIHDLDLADLIIKYDDPVKGPHIRYMYTSVPPRLLRAAEKLTGITLLEHDILLFEGNILWQLFESSQAQEYSDHEEIVHAIADFVPPDRKVLRALAPQVVKMINLKHLYMIPLKREGEPFGFLSLSRPAGIDEYSKKALELVTDKIADIIHRYQTSEALQEANERNAAIVQAHPDLMFRQTRDGTYLDFLSPREDLLVAEPDEIIGQNVKDLALPVEYVEQNLKAAEAALDTGEIQIYEYDLEVKSGLGHFEARVVPLDRNEVLCFVRDITKQKRAEERVTESQQRLSLHVEQTPLGVIEWDLDFKVTSWNEAAEQIFGYSHSEAIGKLARDLIIPPEIFHMIDEVWESLLAQSGGDRSSNENLTKAGDRIVCEWYNTPLVNRQNEVIGVASLVQDITEQELAKQQVSQDLLEKEVMLKEIHHRVKNNLQVIISLLNLQANSSGDQEMREAFQDSINRIYSMALVHEQLYEADDFSNINLPNYIETVLNQIKQAYGLGEQIDIEFSSESIVIGMDRAIPSGLILTEAVTNAVKHAFPDGRAGKIEVGLHSPATGKVELTIQDDGVGIGDEIERVFGNSLGLQLIKLLTAQLEGAFDIENNQPGTRISVRF